MHDSGGDSAEFRIYCFILGGVNDETSSTTYEIQEIY
jgi:hypothetical protein